MKDKKIKSLVTKLEDEYSDVILCLYDNESGKFTMAGRSTTHGFLREMAIRCILMHSDKEEVAPEVTLLDILCRMTDIDKSVKENKAVKEN